MLAECGKGTGSAAGNRMEMWNAEIFPFDIRIAHFEGYRWKDHVF